MRTVAQDLEQAVAYHGHLCSGQVIGVRMARYGAKLLCLGDPRDCRDLIVYVESDRCITDAISTVTHGRTSTTRSGPAASGAPQSAPGQIAGAAARPAVRRARAASGTRTVGRARRTAARARPSRGAPRSVTS